MKVLHILYKLMPSGAEKMLADAADLFKNNGIEGCILANDNEYGPFANVLKAKGYRLFRIPWMQNRIHLIDFWKLCRKERFDVVHIHVIRGYVGFALAAKLAGVKTVVKTFHGIFYPKGRLRLIWHVYQRRVATILGVKFHAISLSVQENEWRRYRNKTKLIWNWVDESKFPMVNECDGFRKRGELGISHDAFVLISVGNCHSESHMRIKNHRLILEALARLPDTVQNKCVYLHVGSEMADTPERRLAEELGVENITRFLGSRQDVHELLCAANLFVMSSLQEGLGNSVIEALMSGRNSLLVNVPGLSDFGKVIPGVRYCEPNALSMANAIVNACEDDCTLEGKDFLRDAAIKNFSCETGVRNLLSLYGVGVV